MSWPQWQPPAQPTMPAMMNTAMPMGIQYTPEQWQQMQQQNWQQWAQWQQQYQQWHQQYGAEYQKSLNAMATSVVSPLGQPMHTNAPPPLPSEARPPPPPEEPNQKLASIQNVTTPTLTKANVAIASAQNVVKPTTSTTITPTKNVQGYNTTPVGKSPVVSGSVPAGNNNAWKSNNTAQGNATNQGNSGNLIKHEANVPKQDITKCQNNFPNPNNPNNKRPSNTPVETYGDMKKNKVEWNNQGYSGGGGRQSPEEDLSDPEKKFMKQFAEWEAQFNKWKEQNQDHPDKTQYREYEKKWEAWRNQLLERRELMRKKRLGLIPSSVNINTSLEMKSSTKVSTTSSTSKPQALMGLDLKDFSGSSQFNSFSATSPSNDSFTPNNSSSLASLFKNHSNDGIPGLDLVDAPSQPEIDLPQRSSDEGCEKMQDSNVKGCDLNLEALSKNINSILGDQKLLSMLNLVSQNSNMGPQTENPPQSEHTSQNIINNQGVPSHQGLQNNSAVQNNQRVQNNNQGGFQIHQGGGDGNKGFQGNQEYQDNQGVEGNSSIKQRTLIEDEPPRWVVNTTAWNQEHQMDMKTLGGFSEDRQNQNIQNHGRDYNSVNSLRPHSNTGSGGGLVGSGPVALAQNYNSKDSEMRQQPMNYQNEQNFHMGNNKMNMAKAQQQPNFRHNNYSIGSSDFTGREQAPTPFSDFDRNEGRFQMNMNVNNRDWSNFDTFSERSADSWQPPNHANVNEQISIAPAPPTITDFDEMLNIEKVINYDHKSKKQPDVVDIKVISPRLFDYRHKLVTRIPLPERPKWLTDTFYNIPEFEPPISRPNPQFPRYPLDRYDYHQPGPPVYNRYEDFGTFSRRPPIDYERQDQHMQSMREYPRLGPDDEKRRKYNNDDYDSYQRRPGPAKWNTDGAGTIKWNADGREGGRRDSRSRDFETRKSRDSRDREPSDIRDTQTNIKASPMNTGTDTGMGSFNQFGNGNGANKQQGQGVNRPMSGHCVSKTCIDDLLNMPGRTKRPPRIVIILRGPPGSGKTFLAKQIKDKETENGGSAPRMLSLDDYFMVEQEKEIVEDGKTIKVKEMVYEYEECMEAAYRQSLLKTFKKTITDGYFSFIIVDNVNDKVKYFDEMWSFAKQNGFQVYIVQLELDVQVCTKRNTHGRSEVEIKHIVAGWEDMPNHYGVLDATNLIQAGSIPEVEMEEINSPNDDFGDDDDDDDEDDEEQACNSSKWDNFECSIDNLAKLDGINKPLRSAGTMEDYLQLEEWTVDTSRDRRPGQKHVRWADLEERKEQEKMRAIGFVVGQTDWGRMMDPTQGGSALTKTKYIERVGIRKVNTT